MTISKTGKLATLSLRAPQGRGNLKIYKNLGLLRPPTLAFARKRGGPRNDEEPPITPFEKKVYAAVSKIPAGETKSYGWVAKKIGSPKAARAVGNALNRNPYPGIIPCHRVVKSDGSIGGFSMGIRLKKALLHKEGIMI